MVSCRGLSCLMLVKPSILRLDARDEDTFTERSLVPTDGLPTALLRRLRHLLRAPESVCEPSMTRAFPASFSVYQSNIAAEPRQFSPAIAPKSFARPLAQIAPSPYLLIGTFVIRAPQTQFCLAYLPLTLNQHSCQPLRHPQDLVILASVSQPNDLLPKQAQTLLPECRLTRR
ncbi:hypothetical protein K458DRAFT_31499 [Lentithecium fluviatile CBS 122367]|uniref:Uncharacterized protein n=1 Tax=Lentithecium fluviatile CBS 122367 TaxID=1168545 RepID=A0A6G1J1L1_9PLEO|nr:hypothetical protein K458DRAFT_31499 [Lentithecium fluviatile CBS 122367]